MATLAFYGWRRSGIYKAISGGTLTPEGRLTGTVTLTLKNTEAPNDSATGAVPFDVIGPGDIKDLGSRAITRVVPPPGTTNADEDKCVFAEFTAADLPWRYTPRLASGLALQPWIVLLVGTADEIKLEPGRKATFAPSLLTDPKHKHDLTTSARWAHVQEEPGHPGKGVARLLNERPLLPLTEYVAVIVPAFNEAGQLAWTSQTKSAVTLPVFYSWRFRTGVAGDFASLAGKLKPGSAPADLGRAPFRYLPLPDAPPLAIRGALAPIGSVDAPLAQSVADDMTVLTTPLVDARRPTVGLPVYGAPWAPDPTTTAWGAVFRSDPRHRGAAGLGTWLAIQAQDRLSAAAGEQAGALLHAAQRVRHLTAGLHVARSLWRRRRPQDANRRLMLLGPSLRRTMTKQGVVLDLITGPGRPFARSMFSSAARRVLRRGPARTRWAKPGASDPGEVIVVANTCPPLPLRAPAGLPHVDALAKATGTIPLDQALATAKKQNSLSPTGIRALFARFDLKPYPNVVSKFQQVMNAMVDRVSKGQPVPLMTMIGLLDPTDGRPAPSEAELSQSLSRLLELPGEDIFDGDEFPFPDPDEPPKRPCTPFPDKLPTETDKTVDPTGEPFIIKHVLDGIEGLDAQKLTPPELCPDLDIPIWQLLRDHAPDWLLPGVQQLPDNSVVSVQTNPVFVEALLLGLNAQTLSELRFRNLPIVSGCTPLRQFWSLADHTTGTFVDDIEGVHRWPSDSPLGSPAHRPATSVGSDLVLVFRTSLFRLYPRTVMYLAPAPMEGGKPNWNKDPLMNNRVMPSFQGTITPEISYFAFNLTPELGLKHWVVLEEPPHGLAFFNTAPKPERQTLMDAAADGANFANAAFADPIRVMLRGDALIPGGA